MRGSILVVGGLVASLSLAGCGTLLPCLSVDGGPNWGLYWTQPELEGLAPDVGHCDRDGVCSGDLSGVNGFWVVWTEGDGPNGRTIHAQVWSDDKRLPDKDRLKPAIERTFDAYGWPVPTYVDTQWESSCD